MKDLSHLSILIVLMLVEMGQIRINQWVQELLTLWKTSQILVSQDKRPQNLAPILSKVKIEKVI